MCGLSEDSLLKCKQMSTGRWVKAFCSITVETAGSQKIPWWKGILICLWKVRVLGRFLDKMQQMSVGSWVKVSCLNSVKLRALKNALLGCDTSISVESAGCQKIP